MVTQGMGQVFHNMKNIVFYQVFMGGDPGTWMITGTLYPDGTYSGDLNFEAELRKEATLRGLDLTLAEDRRRILEIYDGMYLIAREE